MRPTVIVTALLLAATPFAAQAMDTVNTNALKWGPAPPTLPPGTQIAVLSGDPGKDGPFVLRARMPANYKIPAHTHPTDENLTILSGSIHVGMGRKLDTKKGEKISTGGYVRMPKGMEHYLWTTEPSVIQVHGIGPVEFTYVDPKDDPRNKQVPPKKN